MKNQICRQEGLISNSSELDHSYEKNLGFLFNVYLMLRKRLPAFLFNLSLTAVTDAPEKDIEEITYGKMVDHFDELVK